MIGSRRADLKRGKERYREKRLGSQPSGITQDIRASTVAASHGNKTNLSLCRCLYVFLSTSWRPRSGPSLHLFHCEIKPFLALSTRTRTNTFYFNLNVIGVRRLTFEFQPGIKREEKKIQCPHFTFLVHISLGHSCDFGKMNKVRCARMPQRRLTLALSGRLTAV